MKNRKNELVNRQNVLHVRLVRSLLAGLAMLGLQSAVQGQTDYWTGTSLTTSNWSDTANWGGVPVTASNVVFGAALKQANYNDIANLSFTNVVFTNGGWDLSGNPLTIYGVGYLNNNEAGSAVIEMDITNANGIIVSQTAGSVLNLAGAISGSGGITTPSGGNGGALLILANTNNSYSGRMVINSGNLIYYSIAPVGINCSLGAGTGNNGAYITVGSSTLGALTYMGTNDGVSDRAPLFQANGAVTNDSPNNSSLTFGGHVTVTPTSPFTTILSGTSTGTNTFNGVFGDNPAFTGGNYSGGSLQISGPGTWAFNNLNFYTNAMLVSANSHVAFGPTNLNGSALFPNNTLFSSYNLASGSTLDVSAYDANGLAWTLGWTTGYPQTMTIGHTNGTMTDINGGLSLSPSSLALPAGYSTLNIAGTGVAGTLSINGNFVPGTGIINMDVGSTPTSGNDTINVAGNLDLSQGTATLVLAIPGSVQTGVPYTLINYSGTLTGTGSGLAVSLNTPAYTVALVDPTTTPGQIQVTFTATGLPNYLLWSGSVNNNWDIATTPNWLAGANAFNFTNFYSVVFDDSSTQTNVNLVGTLLPYTVTVSNNATLYTLTGSGALANGSLLKAGTGTLVLGSANTYGGGTMINGGTVQSLMSSALGAGAVTLDGGTLNLFTNTGVSPYSLRNSIVLSNAANTISAIGNYYTLNGQISGAGGFTLGGSGSPGLILGNSANNFQGNITINSGAFLRTTTSGVIPNTATVIANGALRLDNNGNTQTISGLTGSGEVMMASPYTTTLVVGANNVSSSFAGSVISSSRTAKTLSLVKIGTGIFTLSGTNNTYTGSTTVNSGTLLVNGLIGGTNGSPVFSTVSVLPGATLGGDGYISGPVTNMAGSTLAPGNFGQPGILTLTNGLGVNGANLSFVLLSPNTAGVTYSRLVVTNGAFVVNGNNVIQLNGPTGTITNGTYVLITNLVARTGSGGFVFPNGSTTSGNFQLTSGPNSVVLTVSANTTSPNTSVTWNGGVNGIWDTVSANWTSGTTATNYLDGDFVTFDDTASVFAITNGIAAPGSVLCTNSTHDYTVAAVIGGIGAVTKSGSGVLTLDGANSYGGGTKINAGTVLAGNSSALGTGAITLNGGTLNVSNNSFANTIILSNANNTILVSGNYETLSGLLTGTGGLTFDGVNTPGFILSNTNNNFQGNITIASNAFLRVNTSGVIPSTAIITNNGNLRLDNNGNTQTFAGLAGSGNVLMASPYTTTLVVGANNTSSTFDGTLVATNSGVKTLSLVKIDTGVFTLTGSSTYTGSTTVSNGTLLVNGSIGGTNGSAVFSTVSVLPGATLGGNGLISGPVTNLAGSTLAPGGLGQAGILTLTNGLGLNGANLSFTLTNDGMAGASYSQLAVNNGAFVVNGDNVIQLTAGNGTFAAGSYILITNTVARAGSGTFVFTNGSTTLNGLQLTSGANSVVLTVTATAPTQSAKITGAHLFGTNLVVTGTNLNGGSSFHYVVLTTTNLATPLASWTPLSTNSFNADGTFSFTNMVNTARPAAYFDTEAVP